MSGVVQADYAGQVVWVIGASFGIGRAFACHMATLGANVVLSARSEKALQTLNAILSEQYPDARHLSLPLDVADAEQVDQAAMTIQQQYTRIDRIVFMAAVYNPGTIDAMDPEFAELSVRVNLLGAMYISYAAQRVFAKQADGGQLALCASVAGYTGLPGGQPYSATKAGMINFAESLYAELPASIDLKLINPGFVRTRITDKNRFYMPLRIEPEEAARKIAQGLRQKRFEIHFPCGFTYWVKMLGSLPYWLVLRITRRLNAMPSPKEH